MEDYASDIVFSDQEEIVDREEGSDAVIRETIGEKAVPSPEADGDTNDVESEEGTAITPVRPLGDATRKRKRKVHRLVDSSSDEDSEDSNALTGKEGLQEIKDLLKQLFKKVEKNSRKLTELQNASDVPSSSAAEYTPKRRKTEISPKVRKEVRRVYKNLVEDDENFDGWNLGHGVSIKSPQNEQTITRIVKEVKGLNPTFDAADIREAAYRFFKTKSEEDSLKRNGMAERKKVTRRRQERVTRKKREREGAVLKNSKFTEEQRKKWLGVMKRDYMSSEESGDDDFIVLHRLPWRSDYVTKMFSKIDAYVISKKSSQAKRQMKLRRLGVPSTRPKPQNAPDWTVKSD
ncbi:hypothetical protein GBAR_LOCUS10650 [Geodia barretti]|nr:hypothetical protein GBAR_LOCUS10650 [Geodia barretti]